MRVIAHDELGPVAANDEVDERKRGADRRDHIHEQVDPLRVSEPGWIAQCKRIRVRTRLQRSRMHMRTHSQRAARQPACAQLSSAQRALAAELRDSTFR